MKRQLDSNTEQVILEAAERLFLDKGFAMTSTVEIAKEAGCKQALVHYYFRSKDKLFDAIFEKKMRKFLSPFLETVDRNIPFEERVKKLVETHFDLLKENPKIPFLFFNELLTNRKRLESFFKAVAELPQSVISRLSNDLKEEVSKGTVRPMNAIDLLITIVSLNVTMFLGAPIIKAGYNISDENFDEIVENRKRENVLIIQRSLRA